MTTVDIGDVKLRVAMEGAGPPLLLVHGFPLNHRMWTEQIEALSSHCQVIAPDLRGFGESPLGDASLVEGGVTMEAFADDLATLLDCLNITEPVHFCGLSMGGYIAWQFWKKYGQRMRSLILCDTRTVSDTEEVARGREMMAVKVLKDGPHFVATSMIPKLLATKTRSDRPELVESLRSMILATSSKGIAAAQRGMAKRPDVTSWLRTIALPTLVIVGEQDTISPVDEMRAISESIGSSRLVQVPDAGHMAPMENSRVVNEAILDFVEAV